MANEQIWAQPRITDDGTIVWDVPPIESKPVREPVRDIQFEILDEKGERVDISEYVLGMSPVKLDDILAYGGACTCDMQFPEGIEANYCSVHGWTYSEEYEERVRVQQSLNTARHLLHEWLEKYGSIALRWMNSDLAKNTRVYLNSLDDEDIWTKRDGWIPCPNACGRFTPQGKCFDCAMKDAREYVERKVKK